MISHTSHLTEIARDYPINAAQSQIFNHYSYLLKFQLNIIINSMASSPSFSLLLLSLMFSIATSLPCSHDHFNQDQPKTFYNDLTDARLLQTAEVGKLRIFVDYTQLTVGTATQINTIKRVMNITASYFYNLVNVTRLSRLFFPTNRTLQCSLLKVPQTYATKGTIGDLGILCGNQQRTDTAYIAKSISCVHLESNKRPIWGMIMFNNNFLKFDQEGFQQILFVGMHEMTHILGFSASMYAMYPKGNPLVQDTNGNNYLNSTDIQRQIRNYFGCNNSKGLPLEDQDGTLIASHWQRKVVGNQFMIATNKKNPMVSLFTLALLNSTGWYTSVDTSFAQPMVWGKGRGCTFLDIDICQFPQFCSNKAFMCDLDGTGIGRCDVDAFSGACMIPKYFVNTICVDQNYQVKNLNAGLNALERGGSSSRCYDSDIRATGLTKSALNNRCYVTVCSASGKSLFILFGTYVLVCTKEGQTIPAPVGFDGTLTCPKNFANYCAGKKTCSYHCNKNGACINGKCLCTGTALLSNNCADVSIFQAPIGNTGGFVNAFTDISNQLTLTTLTTNITNTPPPKYIQRDQIKKYSINSKCIQGTTYDILFGECLQCQDVFGCTECDDNGCISCNDGSRPSQSGRC